MVLRGKKRKETFSFLGLVHNCIICHHHHALIAILDWTDFTWTVALLAFDAWLWVNISLFLFFFARWKINRKKILSWPYIFNLIICSLSYQPPLDLETFLCLKVNWNLSTNTQYFNVYNQNIKFQLLVNNLVWNNLITLIEIENFTNLSNNFFEIPFSKIALRYIKFKISIDFTIGHIC